MKARLQGRVVDGSGVAINGAVVRLVGGLETLGGDPQAVCMARGAVTYTRPVTGFSGNLWNAWQKFVAREVAGISWPEFRLEAARYNPALYETGGIFRAECAYALPENRARADTPGALPAIVWDRRLQGFAGDTWHCWRQFVQGKVLGLKWGDFRQVLRVHNPSLAGGLLQPDQRYVLPRAEGLEDYLRVDVTHVAGRFAFANVEPGTYRLHVTARNYRPLRGEVTVGADTGTVLEMAPSGAVRAPEGAGPMPPMAEPAPPGIAGAAAAGGFVGVQGRRFVLKGQSFQFIGVNLRGLVYYGTPTLPFANLQESLSAAVAMGARVARVFLPNRDMSVDDAKDRLGRLLEAIKAGYPDMHLIVALTNLYGDVPFFVPGDQGCYVAAQGGGPQILSCQWFVDGYREHYMPFVESVVTAFRAEPAIMAYDIGNELKADGEPELLIALIHAVAGRIRELDPNHLITTGMISTRHAWMASRDDLRLKLYDTDLLDFITNHAYHIDGNNVPSPEDDSDLSERLNKPLIIEEAGFAAGRGMDRTPWYVTEMDRLFGRGASGYMPWGFMPGADNADGDRDVGFDRHFHTDWDSLYQKFSERARKLASLSVPVTPAVPAITPGGKVFTVAVVKLRSSPGYTGKPDDDVLAIVPLHTPGVVQGPSVTKDGLTWWPVRMTLAGGNTQDGWMAEIAPSGDVLLQAG